MRRCGERCGTWLRLVCDGHDETRGVAVGASESVRVCESVERELHAPGAGVAESGQMRSSGRGWASRIESRVGGAVRRAVVSVWTLRVVLARPASAPASCGVQATSWPSLPATTTSRSLNLDKQRRKDDTGSFAAPVDWMSPLERGLRSRRGHPPSLGDNSKRGALQLCTNNGDTRNTHSHTQQLRENGE